GRSCGRAKSSRSQRWGTAPPSTNVAPSTHVRPPRCDEEAADERSGNSDRTQPDRSRDKRAAPTKRRADPHASERNPAKSKQERASERDAGRHESELSASSERQRFGGQSVCLDPRA